MDRIATSLAISLQVDGIILCLIFKSFGSYKDIDDESLPRIIIKLREGEKINLETGFFSSNFLSFLFLSFAIFGL